MPKPYSGIIAADGREIKQHGTREFPCALYFSPQLDLVPWHWHEEYELSVLYRGKALYHTPQGQFTLEAGDGIFLNSGTLHSAQLTPGGACQKADILFHGRLVYGDKDSVFWKKYIRPLSSPEASQVTVLRSAVPWQAEILEKLKKAHRLYKNQPEGYEFQVRALLSEILFDLFCYSEGPEKDTSAGNRMDNDRIKQMLLYLQEHYAQPVTLAQLSQVTSLCERECLRCFKKVVRMSPIQYLIHYRIARACILLREEELSVLEVSSHCGFESPSYFTKTFRRITGCTPSEYRNKKSEKHG